MMMDDGGCLPDQPLDISVPAPCLYWNDHIHRQFHGGMDASCGAAGSGYGRTRLNLCGCSVDLMADVLLHSTLLQESHSLSPISTADVDAGSPLSAGAAATITTSPELAPMPGSATSLGDLPCIPPPLQDAALWWILSSDFMGATLAPRDNNMIPTTSPAPPQDATPGSALTAHQLEVSVESESSLYLPVCKDDVVPAGTMVTSAIHSHCAGNAAAAVDESVDTWRNLTAPPCCTSGNAASSGDSEDSDLYAAAGCSVSYAYSGQGAAAAVVDVSFVQHATSPTQLVNDSAAVISPSSPYLEPQQLRMINANRVACSDPIGSLEGGSSGGCPRLPYSGNNTSASTATDGSSSFSIDFENPTTMMTTSKPPKRPRSADRPSSSSAYRRPSTPSIDFRFRGADSASAAAASYEPDAEEVTHLKELIYRAAAFRPVNLGAEEAVERPRRKNVRISSDPQTVAARHRRERISERLRVLQRLVPGGSKMDTASMLDEAANYLKFLKSQVSELKGVGSGGGGGGSSNRPALGFKNAIINAEAATTTSIGSCGGLPILPSSIQPSYSTLSYLDHGFNIPPQSSPKTIPSQLRDHSIELGNRVLH